MTNILDQITKPASKFRPTNIEQYTLFQMLRGHGITSLLPAHIAAAERNSVPSLLQAYRKSIAKKSSAEVFLKELSIISSNPTA